LQKFNFEIDEITQRQNEKAEKDHYQKFPGWVFYLFSFHCCWCCASGWFSSLFAKTMPAIITN